MIFIFRYDNTMEAVGPKLNLVFLLHNDFILIQNKEAYAGEKWHIQVGIFSESYGPVCFPIYSLPHSGKVKSC